MKSAITRLLVSFSRVLLVGGLLATIAVTCVYLYHLAVNIRSDTTSVTNGAFIITGTLSALFFSWAQSLLAEDKDRDRVLFAGERLLHGSLFLILASVLKYAALNLMTYQTPEIPRPTLHLISDAFGILAVPLFLFAVGDMLAGVVVALRILWPRTTRYLVTPPAP